MQSLLIGLLKQKGLLESLKNKGQPFEDKVQRERERTDLKVVHICATRKQHHRTEEVILRMVMSITCLLQ